MNPRWGLLDHVDITNVRPAGAIPLVAVSNSAHAADFSDYFVTIDVSKNSSKVP